jgi:hypothetical protein
MFVTGSVAHPVIKRDAGAPQGRLMMTSVIIFLFFICTQIPRVMSVGVYYLPASHTNELRPNRPSLALHVISG